MLPQHASLALSGYGSWPSDFDARQSTS